MGAATRRFGETKEPKAREEVATLQAKLAKISRIEVLENALAKCRETDMRTSEVYAALDFLAQYISPRWPSGHS